jgi:predicted dehydrogenase
MIPIGLLGCGTVAQYGHLPAIAQTPGLLLAAVYDPDRVRAEETARRFGVPVGTSDIDEFYGSKIEAVTITSAAEAHRENVFEAARRGTHVLCEKPLALLETEAEDMIQAMLQADLLFFTAFCYRFSPSALHIKRLVQEGAIGKVRSLRLIYNWDCHGKYEKGPDGTRIVQRRREGRMLEGGVMIDCGTHQIDLARWWLGKEVKRISAAGAWLDDYDAPDHMYLHMDHEGGVHTLVEISYSYGYTIKKPRVEFVYELIGTEGVIRYDREARRFDIRTPSEHVELPFHPEKDFVGMYRAFAEALTGSNSHNLSTAADGLAATRLARSATAQAMASRSR